MLAPFEAASLQHLNSMKQGTLIFSWYSLRFEYSVEYLLYSYLNMIAFFPPFSLVLLITSLMNEETVAQASRLH